MVHYPLSDEPVRDTHLPLKCHVMTRAMKKVLGHLLGDNTPVVHKNTKVLPQDGSQELPGPPPLPPHFLGCQTANFVPFCHSGKHRSRIDPVVNMEISEETKTLHDAVQAEGVKANGP
jgi:hypothetical protein